VVVAFFECPENPAAEPTLAKYKSIVCGSDEHNEALPAMAIGLVLYVVGFYLKFLHSAWVAPSMWMDVGFREKWKFMLTRWRPDVWYWGCVVMTRNLLVAFAGIVSGEPRVQLVYVVCVVVIVFSVTGVYQPWRAPVLNHYDVVSSIVLSFIGIFGLIFVSLQAEVELAQRFGMDVQKKEDEQKEFARALTVLIAIFLALFGALCVWSGGSSRARSIVGARPGPTSRHLAGRHASARRLPPWRRVRSAKLSRGCCPAGDGTVQLHPGAGRQAKSGTAARRQALSSSRGCFRQAERSSLLDPDGKRSPPWGWPMGKAPGVHRAFGITPPRAHPRTLVWRLSTRHVCMAAHPPTIVCRGSVPRRCFSMLSPAQAQKHEKAHMDACGKLIKTLDDAVKREDFGMEAARLIHESTAYDRNGLENFLTKVFADKASPHSGATDTISMNKAKHVQGQISA
jgi:hypothetical protein